MIKTTALKGRRSPSERVTFCVLRSKYKPSNLVEQRSSASHTSLWRGTTSIGPSWGSEGSTYTSTTALLAAADMMASGWLLGSSLNGHYYLLTRVSGSPNNARDVSKRRVEGTKSTK